MPLGASGVGRASRGMQALKHVTVAEALRLPGGLVRLAALDHPLAAPATGAALGQDLTADLPAVRPSDQTVRPQLSVRA